MDTLGAMVVPIAAITENTVMNDKILTSHNGMIASIVKTVCSQRGGEIDLDQSFGVARARLHIALAVRPIAVTF